jgi:hypothetical protein
MNPWFRQSIACGLLAAASLLAPAAAQADPTADVLRSSVVQPAAAALRASLQAPPIEAQARPVGEPERPLRTPGLPTGFSYTLDVSSAWSQGTTGHGNGLPGGFDAVVGYGFTPHERLQLGYYTFQEYPLGFNTGIVPVYVQGLATPVGTQSLNAAAQDVTVDNHILVANWQNLITVGGRLPIVITPTYISRTGTVGGHSDEQLLEINGFPQNVRLRTVEYYLLAVTFPFLSTPKMFGTFTIAPQVNVNLNGANTTNHVQLFQLGYLEYRPTDRFTAFFQPSRLVNYLPPDPYPQHIVTFIYGASWKFTKQTFAQVVFSTGTPSNIGTLGVQSLTLQQLPSPANPLGVAAPAITGLKASQIQLQFGIGSPSVIPL